MDTFIHIIAERFCNFSLDYEGPLSGILFKAGYHVNERMRENCYSWLTEEDELREIEFVLGKI